MFDDGGRLAPASLGRWSGTGLVDGNGQAE
jgi:hypothetical protein